MRVYLPEQRMVELMGRRGWWFTARFLLRHGQLRLLVSRPMRGWGWMALRRWSQS